MTASQRRDSAMPMFISLPGKSWILGILFGLCCLVFDGCKKTISEDDFVGKWQSSRAVTPIHLAANGEWEIRQDDGTVLQYGLWRYEEKQIIWNVMQAGRLVSDRNPVLLVAPMQFHLKEADGAVTVFRRLP